MYKKFCDRCEKQITSSQPRATEQKIDGEGFHLCDECTSKFEEWMRSLG